MKLLLPSIAASDLSQLMLVLFVVFFTGVIFWVYRQQRSGVYEQIEKFPLRDDGDE